MAPASKPILTPLLKAAGCATAFFLGGPIAGAMAAWAGESLGSLLDEKIIGSALKAAAGELPKGLSGGFGNFIAGAFYDQLKQAIEPQTLRPVFRQALAAALEAIRAEWVPTRPASERALLTGIFNLWRDRLAKDDLDEFDDATIQSEFQRAESSEALKPLLIGALIRLSHTGLSLQSRGLAPHLEKALSDLLPKYLPSLLVAALSGHDGLWKQVMHRQIDHVVDLLGKISDEQSRQGDEQKRQGAILDGIARQVGAHPPPIAARLLTADSAALQPRQGAILGRESEVSEVAGRLTAANGHIVYVHGAPGIGKSEVCRAALRHLLRMEPATRALFVDCKSAQGQLLARCAQALGDSGLKGEQIPGAFDRLARTQPLLLYFDNFETVERDPGTFTLVRELAATDGVRILCSTRTDLSAAIGAGIVIHRLQPQPALDLFLRCWHGNTKAPKLEPSAELAEFLDRKLSRHPLSIVLTSARGAIYRSLPKLIAEWNAKGVAIASSPDESLATSFSLSFSLLTPDQKQFALLLALFPEGISAETWEDLADLESHAWDCRERLSELNLIETPGSPEVAMLAPIREFVFEAAPELRGDLAIATAFRYYVPLSKQAAQIDASANLPRARMVTELPNLLGLLSHLEPSAAKSLEANLAVLADKLYNPLMRAPLAGRPVAAVMVRLCEATDSESGQAHALLNLGQLEFLLGENGKARESYEKALPLYAATGDQVGQANTLRNLGELEFLLGENGKARASYDEALRLYAATGDQLGQANTLLNLGQLEFMLGENEKARASSDEALRLYAATGDQLGQANTLLNLGELEFRLGENGKARESYEKALPLYAATGDQLGQANTLRNLGELEFRLGENGKARARYEKALPLYAATGSWLGQANTLRNLGQLEFRLGENGKARASYEKALPLYAATGSQLGQANTLRNLGELEFRLGENGKARASYEKALPLYAATGSQVGQANTLRNLGELEFRLGENGKARESYEKALPLYAATGSPLGQANTLLNLGQLEFLLGENGKARESYEKALPLYAATGDQLGQANTLRNLGELEFRLGENGKARESYEKALPLYAATGDQLGQANTLLNLGELEFRLGENGKARESYEKALPLYAATGSQVGQANTLRNLGELEFRLGENGKARESYEKALPLYAATGSPLGQANTLRNLGELEFRLGENGKARESYEKALRLYAATGDQLGQANTLRSLGELEFRLGENGKARASYEKALALNEAVAEPVGLAASHGLLALLDEQEGHHSEACIHVRQASDYAQRSGSPGVIQWVAALPIEC